MTWSIFLDYDGTLADGAGISAPNREAIAAARDRGVKVFIATGRPRCMMPEGTLELVDGFIGSAGAFIQVDGTILLNEGMAPETAVRLAHTFERDNSVWTLDAYDALYTSQQSFDRLVQWHATDSGEHFDVADVLRHLEVIEMGSLTPETVPVVSKSVVWKTNVSVFETVKDFTDDLDAIPASVPGLDTTGEGGELFLAHITKATGMRWVLEHLGLDPQKTIAVGDSHNDITMLQDAARGFAVEIAPPALREVAEATVPGPSGGGVGKALELVGLM